MILCNISSEFHLNYKFIIIKIISTVVVQSLSNTFYLFSRTFEVFNEMEMEVNVINNEKFAKFYLKIRVRQKEIS